MPPASFLDSLGPTEYFALILAAAITVVIALTISRRSGPWIIGTMAFLSAPVVALFSTQFNIVGWHAFMQSSTVFQIIERGQIPPEEPLFAGGALRYPWVEHMVTAQAARLTGVSPLILTMGAQAVAWLVFLAAAAWMAAALTRDRVTVALAALLSGFGISIFHSGLLKEPIERAFPPLWLESRVVPVDKFLSVTSAPFGYAAMLVAAAAGVHLVCGMGPARRLILLIAGCTLFAALIHPLSWLGILVYQGVAVAVLIAGPGRADFKRAGLLAFAVSLPSLLCLPYLRLIGASDSSDGWMGLTQPASLLGAKAADLLFFLATFALLACLHRAELGRLLRERNRAAIMSLLAVGALAVAYLVVREPGRNEYKFLLQLVPAAAGIMALSLRARLASNPLFGFMLLFFLLMPGARVLGDRPWFSLVDHARLDGLFLRSVDPDADALYQWVTNNTPRDAVFIAPDLRIPPLGRRSLYIPLEATWLGRDGWGLPRASLLQWHIRRPDAAMFRRQQLAGAVLNPNWEFPVSAVMAAIQADVPGRAVFVHAPRGATATKLESTAGFIRRFSNAAGTVFEAGNGLSETSRPPRRRLDLRARATEAPVFARGDATPEPPTKGPLADDPQTLLNRSLAAYQAGDFTGCIDAAQAALRLRPDYAEAYNNISAGCIGLHRWDDAMQAALEAVLLRPDYQLARNNLAWAESAQKRTELEQRK